MILELHEQLLGNTLTKLILIPKYAFVSNLRQNRASRHYEDKQNKNVNLNKQLMCRQRFATIWAIESSIYWPFYLDTGFIANSLLLRPQSTLWNLNSYALEPFSAILTWMIIGLYNTVPSISKWKEIQNQHLQNQLHLNELEMVSRYLVQNLTRCLQL